MKQQTVDELVAAAERLRITVRLSDHRSKRMKSPVPCVELDGHGSLARCALDIVATPGYTEKDRKRLESDLRNIRVISLGGKGGTYYCYY